MIEKHIVDSKKASLMWGGIHIGYIVTDDEIKRCQDDIYGDVLITVMNNEIQNVVKLDMCDNGKMSCRKSAHCVGEGCDFCGKFTALYGG